MMDLYAVSSIQLVRPTSRPMIEATRLFEGGKSAFCHRRMFGWPCRIRIAIRCTYHHTNSHKTHAIE